MSLSRQTEPSHRISGNRTESQYWTFLMCPPDHFRIEYEINPWMNPALQPNLELARNQWDNLVSNLTRAGATVELIPPVAPLPDMVFTADIGLIDKHRFIKSRFRYAERQPEVQHGVKWFRSRNYEVIDVPLGTKTSLESSDIRPFRGFVLVGYGFRTSLASQLALAHLVQCEVLPLKLVDPRLYHLDLSFCPLDDHRAMIAPSALSRRSCALIEKLIPQPLVLEPDEALTFCANAIVLGKTVIMPFCPARVGRILEHWGFTICISPVSEFLKAGGGVHCLTLALHESFSQSISRFDEDEADRQ